MNWTKDKKPVRSREPFQSVPEDAKLDEGKFKPKRLSGKKLNPMNHL